MKPEGQRAKLHQKLHNAYHIYIRVLLYCCMYCLEKNQQQHVLVAAHMSTHTQRPKEYINSLIKIIRHNLKYRI